MTAARGTDDGHDTPIKRGLTRMGLPDGWHEYAIAGETMLPSRCVELR